MATTDTTGSSTTTLPVGKWRVDSAASELGFKARGTFGLIPVKGSFGGYDGTLDVSATGASGELRINAETLDTGMGMRDKHLRSADFFDVANSPTVTFQLTEVTPATDGGLTLSGTLKIRDNSLELTAPLTASAHGDHLHLDTELSVDRDAAGLGWAKAGMIKGDAQLSASLVLTREA